MSQGKTKSCYSKIFKSQYLLEFLRYGPVFLHLIITFIGFQKAFSNIRSQGAPLLNSRGWRLAPPQDFVAISNVRVDRVKNTFCFTGCPKNKDGNMFWIPSHDTIYLLK